MSLVFYQTPEIGTYQHSKYKVKSAYGTSLWGYLPNGWVLLPWTSGHAFHDAFEGLEVLNIYFPQLIK